MVSLLVALLTIWNPARGGDWFKLLFNWYTQTLFYGLAAYALSGMWFVGVLAALQWAFLWVTGTGGLHQAFTSINNPKEFKPFDWLAHKLAVRWSFGISYHNAWGIWYGTLVGFVMGIPLLGLLCRATIYWRYNWRITEGLIALYYWLSFILIIGAISFS
jgi:hypothetical protein